LLSTHLHTLVRFAPIYLPTHLPPPPREVVREGMWCGKLSGGPCPTQVATPKIVRGSCPAEVVLCFFFCKCSVGKLSRGRQGIVRGSCPTEVVRGSLPDRSCQVTTTPEGGGGKYAHSYTRTPTLTLSHTATLAIPIVTGSLQQSGLCRANTVAMLSRPIPVFFFFNLVHGIVAWKSRCLAS